MENPIKNQDGAVISLSFEGRLDRMSKLRDFFFGKELERDQNDPLASDIDSSLRLFEELLEQAKIEFTGSDSEQRDLNLQMEAKLKEYRERMSRSNSSPDSKEYKDSLYKLMIGSDLRNEGIVRLEKVLEKIEKIVGEDKIDMDILKNAWNVMSARAERRPNVLRGKTSF